MEKNKQDNNKGGFNIVHALKMPGTIAAIYTVSVVLYLNGYPNLAFAMATAFAVPFIFLFVLESLLDRNISVKTHILFMGIVSYLFFMLSYYDALQDGMETIIATHITFLLGLASTLSIMLIYYGLYQFFPSKDRRTLFFVAFIPAVVIPSVVIYVVSGQMAIAEAEGENISFLDIWSVWHIMVSFAVGLLAYPVIKKFFGEKAEGSIKFGIAVGIPILFEAIEQSFLKNIMGLTPEFLGNSILDIIIGACVIYLGYEISKYIKLNNIIARMR